MAITRIGEISLTAAVPLLSEFQAALSVAQGLATAELQGKLSGLAGLLAAITISPPDLSANLTAAIDTVASIQAQIALPSPPTATVQVGLIAALIAELEGQLSLLTASIPIPTASINMYAYQGAKSSIGTELQGVINTDFPSAGTSRALILVASTDAAWEALSQVFRTS